MTVDPEISRAALDAFRARVLADAAMQDALLAIDDTPPFIAEVMARARALGLELDEDHLKLTLRQDPLGLSRWSDGPPAALVPRPGWLPINILPAEGQLCVDWAFFGAQDLREPFFEDSVRTALRLPFNRLARYRTRLADLAHDVAQRDHLRPSGFIFHMSRCGSTLVSQMLAADPGNIVVSEAGPLDTAVRIDHGPGAAAAEAHARLLVAMVGALGQRRSAAQSRYFVKLDSWHTIAMPLFRRAFPDVPWVFLYREPSEVLASQMLQRGIQTVPEYLPPALFGLTMDDAMPQEDYCASVLGRTCEAVLEPLAQGGGLLVNYSQLPQALWSSILPHFGIVGGSGDRAAMMAAAKHDAKNPSLAFSPDEKDKRRIMTEALRATAERCMGDVYRRLEARRLSL